jgi:erythromycin esterase-like protein
MAMAMARSGAARERVMHLQMVASLQRALAREFLQGSDLTRGRDQSMYLNLRWLAARLGPRAKIIVWANSAHIARDARTSASFPEGGNLGAWVDRSYGRRAFALGFSAYGGAWRSVFSRADEPIAPAPPGTLEALALTGTAQGSVYRNNAWLARIGRVPGQPFFYHQTPAYWARVFDGMVVFRAERAPTRNN